MDKWEDYPIKVLGIAPLIMVMLSTVSSFSSTCGCFLRVERSFSRTISLLFSLSSLWTASQANGSLPANSGASTHLGLKGLHAQEKGGPNRHYGGPGRPAWADWPRPILARFGRPFAPVGPHVFMHFAPPFAPFWRCHPRVQDEGSPCMKSGLLRFNPRGCSFVTLWSLPPLGVISSSS
jgi:hypothetical protein